MAEKGAKKKLTKRNAEGEISLVATSEEGAASPHHKLLKKHEQNFPDTLAVELPTSPHSFAKIQFFGFPLEKRAAIYPKTRAAAIPAAAAVNPPVSGP